LGIAGQYRLAWQSGQAERWNDIIDQLPDHALREPSPHRQPGLRRQPGPRR
jgi:hypothetical protein